MSTMSSLVHHEMHDLPNDVHNTDSKDTTAPKPKIMPKSQSVAQPEYNENGNALTPEAERRLNSLQNKSVRPAMYYTDDVRRPYKNGAWQSSHTVERELEYREETPRG